MLSGITICWSSHFLRIAFAYIDHNFTVFDFWHFSPHHTNGHLSFMCHHYRMHKIREQKLGTKATHSLIRGVRIQSCTTGAKKFTNYLFCHPQFSSVIQNIENCCAIRAKFWKFDFWLYKINYFDNNRHRQTGVKMAQRFSIFWITPLNCTWQNT